MKISNQKKKKNNNGTHKNAKKEKKKKKQTAKTIQSIACPKGIICPKCKKNIKPINKKFAGNWGFFACCSDCGDSFSPETKVDKIKYDNSMDDPDLNYAEFSPKELGIYDKIQEHAFEEIMSIKSYILERKHRTPNISNKEIRELPREISKYLRELNRKLKNDYPKLVEYAKLIIFSDKYKLLDEFKENRTNMDKIKEYEDILRTTYETLNGMEKYYHGVWEFYPSRVDQIRIFDEYKNNKIKGKKQNYEVEGIEKGIEDTLKNMENKLKDILPIIQEQQINDIEKIHNSINKIRKIIKDYVNLVIRKFHEKFSETGVLRLSSRSRPHKFLMLD